MTFAAFSPDCRTTEQAGSARAPTTTEEGGGGGEIRLSGHKHSFDPSNGLDLFFFKRARVPVRRSLPFGYVLGNTT